LHRHKADATNRIDLRVVTNKKLKGVRQKIKAGMNGKLQKSTLRESNVKSFELNVAKSVNENFAWIICKAISNAPSSIATKIVTYPRRSHSVILWAYCHLEFVVANK